MTVDNEFIIQILTDRGLITSEMVRPLREYFESEDSLLDVESAILRELQEQAIFTPNQLLEVLSEEFSMEVVNLANIEPDPKAIAILDPEQAKQNHILPISCNDVEVVLAISDPLNVDMIDSLSHVLGKAISPRLALLEEIDRAIVKHYGNFLEKKALVNNRYDQDSSNLFKALDKIENAEEAVPIIEFVHGLIEDAFERRASDIHIEPLEKKFRIRLRIDGKLQEIGNPPKRLQPSIIARLKLMANVKLAEKRIPQDGRIQHQFTNLQKREQKVIDLRVSVLPTSHGESIVMRILDKEGLKLGLSELGFFSDDQNTFEKVVSLPDGVFLVTGPTGSGKSTTLYTGLSYINNPDRKIITVEDPVEYEIAGINQVQVRKDVDMTFASALRSILRQAPNIIMIGEIRDVETAEIAINASLTGHMVLSTLHTNDAVSAITRLIDIGVEPFLVSAALRAAMAQRLVRQLHPECKEPYNPKPKELTALGMDPQKYSNCIFMKPIPNPKISATGYKGRKGIFEIFNVDDEMAQMIYERRTLVELRKKAILSGMRTMRKDGIRKIIAGLTSSKEVLSVTL